MDSRIVEKGNIPDYVNYLFGFSGDVKPEESVRRALHSFSDWHMFFKAYPDPATLLSELRNVMTPEGLSVQLDQLGGNAFEPYLEGGKLTPAKLQEVERNIAAIRQRYDPAKLPEHEAKIRDNVRRASRMAQIIRRRLEKRE